MANSLPRGLRNNNPGNIEDGPFARSMPGYTGSDGRFATFATLDDGGHAMQRLLAGYGAKGLNTVQAIVNRWAPPGENDSSAYAGTVAKHLGVGPHDQIDTSDPQVLAKLSSAMAQVENGRPVELSAYAGGSGSSPAAGAVNAEAGAAPRLPVQTVNYVPPPFSQQQDNYTPLIGDQPAPQSQAPQTIERAPTPPVAAPDANQDPLKAWGIDAEQPSANEQQPVAPQDDILKAWGVDANEPTPAGDLAKSQTAAPADTSFGQKVGNAIDTAAGYAAPVAGFVNNVGRQIATGVPVIGGALNKADAATNALIAPVLNPLFSKENQLQGNTFGERYQNSLAMQNGQDQQFQTDHPIISTGSQIAGGIGALGGLASAVPAAGSVLGLSGSLGARTLAGGLSGAALGGADAAVRSEGDPEAIATGAATGGLLGAVAPAAGAVIGGVANKLVGGAVPQRVAQLAQLARDKYGINVGPGQLSTNPTIKFLDSVVNRLPMSGGTAAKEAQQTAFNSAVANSFGETAKEITPEVIDAAKGRIGNVFDSVAERTPAIKADGQFQDDILNTFKEADQTLQSSEIEPLRKMMLGIVQKYKEGGNAIDGETYQALTRKGAPLDRLMNSNDPNIAYSAGQIRDALDGTLERSAPPAALNDLRTARSQWKALKTVEPLAAKSATGDISPALLMGQASKSYGTASYGKGSDLVDLARIGQQFLKEAPSSGTAERSMLQNILLGGAGGGGALGVAGLAANPGAIPFALGGALASGVASRGLGAALRSPYLANKMIQNGLGQSGANYLLRSVPQGVAVPQVNQRRPLELTVKPNKLQ
jgi:hypothetical protein